MKYQDLPPIKPVSKMGFLFSLSGNLSPLCLCILHGTLRSMEYKSIPNALRKYRRIRGLSQKQVAKFLGLKNASRISRWERGDCLPSLVNAVRLATLYRTLVDGIFGDLVKVVRTEIHDREKKNTEKK